MKVILLAHVKKLGAQGAVVEVAEGFAHNFLFRQGLAAPATGAAIAQAKARAARAKRHEKKDTQAARKLGTKLENYHLVMNAKTNESGTLYAAITPEAISTALKKDGFDVTAAMVDLKDPIKELTTEKIALKLPHGFTTTITVQIEST